MTDIFQILHMLEKIELRDTDYVTSKTTNSLITYDDTLKVPVLDYQKLLDRISRIKRSLTSEIDKARKIEDLLRTAQSAPHVEKKVFLDITSLRDAIDHGILSPDSTPTSLTFLRPEAHHIPSPTLVRTDRVIYWEISGGSKSALRLVSEGTGTAEVGLALSSSVKFKGPKETFPRTSIDAPHTRVGLGYLPWAGVVFGTAEGKLCWVSKSSVPSHLPCRFEVRGEGRLTVWGGSEGQLFPVSRWVRIVGGRENETGSLNLAATPVAMRGETCSLW
eukprot:gnl/Dysnectes_brevis/1467_a1661_1424.p1 GENE.gnl/Dysnectes_brevis/1467_a1661_1424~~gnl/Dysnectes_brevis/1467_a1661_1424.p1  ORF type:complete len:276 (-),score=60.45 gnl/Dysnectes_brevis/1467_a1661_1424:218-1045(-)